MTSCVRHRAWQFDTLKPEFNFKAKAPQRTVGRPDREAAAVEGAAAAVPHLGSLRHDLRM